ncbi:MAG: hypothetical protein ACRDZO_16210 [Egibacteraceae bacterium]
MARTIVYGHLGDGNLHVNVLGPGPEDQMVEDAVYRLVASLALGAWAPVIDKKLSNSCASAGPISPCPEGAIGSQALFSEPA